MNDIDRRTLLKFSLIPVAFSVPYFESTRDRILCANILFICQDKPKYFDDCHNYLGVAELDHSVVETGLEGLFRVPASYGDIHRTGIARYWALASSKNNDLIACHTLSKGEPVIATNSFTLATFFFTEEQAKGNNERGRNRLIA